ncbi:MAG: VWA domain-containing protein [Calditrichaeota bacterium]|nr:MAG: VWA domain-containing protein [Calditrichota bacterium]
MNRHQQNLIHRKTELSANVVAFCRYLRNHGFNVTASDQADVLRALSMVPLSDRDMFRLTLRAVLTKTHPEQLRFDELFSTYWEELSRAVDSKIKQDEEPGEQNRPKPRGQNLTLQSLQSWLRGSQVEDEEETAAYSPVEVLTHKDFSTFTDAQLKEVMKLITLIAKSLALRSTRRYEKSRRSAYFDLRRTMRRNLRRGGEILDIAFRQKKIRKLKLVMLCDVSKSMDLYSQFLIQFIYAFQSVYRQVETFVFSTSLHRITEQLQSHDFRSALKGLEEEVPDWSGGTKIGASLNTFVEEYGTKLLDNRSIVLILSDGWDTGDIQLLEESMAQIHRRAAKVIWLNPLAGSREFQPTVRGLQAALPYIDVFAPAHNVESLRNLVKLL